jgi:hypothetical protein
MKDLDKVKKLDLKKFIVYFSNFDRHHTWTKEKHKEYNILFNYLSKHEHVSIKSHSKSNTTKVEKTNDFVVFQVDKKQSGYLKEYRNLWVLMYNEGKLRSTNYLKVYPLRHQLIKRDILFQIHKTGFQHKVLNFNHFYTFKSVFDFIWCLCEEDELEVTFRYETYGGMKLYPVEFSKYNKALRYGISRALHNWICDNNVVIPWSEIDLVFSRNKMDLRVEVINKVIDRKKYPDYIDNNENVTLEVDNLRRTERIKINWNDVEWDDQFMNLP